MPTCGCWSPIRRSQVVYIATPHQFHAPHAILAAEHGKHIILEKPMALTLADCDAIIAAVERHKVHLIVGHTHAFDPAVRLMRDIIARGELGRLGLIHSFNYTNYLYRPRRPEELDTAQGGGILFNQVPHQIDTARLLGRRHRPQRARQHDRARSVAADRRRAAPRCCNSTTAPRRRWSTAATIISIPTNGTSASASAARRSRSRTAPPAASLAKAQDETRARTETFAYGAASGELPPHQPHFGVTIVTCAEGDMRASADGVTIYDRDGMRQIPIPRGGSMPGRREVLDDMRVAIRSGQPPVHNGRWGKATVEVALAILQSAREGREVALEHQVAVDGSSG